MLLNGREKYMQKYLTGCWDRLMPYASGHAGAQQASSLWGLLEGIVRNYVRLVAVIRGRATHLLYQERSRSPAAQ